MKRFCFPKSKRLVKGAQFKAVLADRACASDELLRLYMAKNDCGFARLGVSVGKSCGKAVVRNRFKRRVREVFRQNQEQIPSDFDYLVMISPKLLKAAETKDSVRQVTFDQVSISFLGLADEISRKLRRK